MIMVTVGTCGFDALIQTVDELQGKDRLDGRVVCQIGSGDYQPRHCEYFRYEPTLQPWYDKADVVICHGGTGTVHELLTRGAAFVAVANTSLSGNHQSDFLAACEKEFGICWCRRLDDLPKHVEWVRAHRPPAIAGRHVADDIKRYLDRLAPSRRPVRGM